MDEIDRYTDLQRMAELQKSKLLVSFFHFIVAEFFAVLFIRNGINSSFFLPRSNLWSNGIPLRQAQSYPMQWPVMSPSFSLHKDRLLKVLIFIYLRYVSISALMLMSFLQDGIILYYFLPVPSIHKHHGWLSDSLVL